ncbi:hypothetical protein ABZX90_33015 [Streptomyces sp. NPDC002935]|uniref:hypothetical protein n=1 Tax=Streptomyces sp. NPDC002935 TaxID=3154545 RepID=UPI0033B56235
MTRRKVVPDTFAEDRVVRILLAEQLDSVLNTLSEREVHVVTAHVALCVPAHVIAQELGLTIRRVLGISSKTMSKLRHRSRSQALTNYDLEDGGDGPLSAPSRKVQEIAGTYGVNAFIPCAYEPCRMRFLGRPPGQVGRPRKYCSDSCRQNACRARRRAGRQEP